MKNIKIALSLLWSIFLLLYCGMFAIISFVVTFFLGLAAAGWRLGSRASDKVVDKVCAWGNKQLQ